MTLEDMNYFIQEALECCQNCAEKDEIYEVVGGKQLICTLYNDPVDPLGKCDVFTFYKAL